MIGNNIRGIVGTGLMIASFAVGGIMVNGLNPTSIAINQAKNTYAVASNPSAYIEGANQFSNTVIDGNSRPMPMTAEEKKALYEKLLAAEVANQQGLQQNTSNQTTSNTVQLPVAVQTQGSSPKTTIPTPAKTTTTVKSPTPTKTTTVATNQQNTAAQQQAAQQAALAAQQAADAAAAQQAAQFAAQQVAAQAAAQAAADAAAAQQVAAQAAAQAAADAAAAQQASGRRTRAS